MVVHLTLTADVVRGSRAPAFARIRGNHTQLISRNGLHRLLHGSGGGEPNTFQNWSLRSMSSVSPHVLRDRVTDRLAPHGSEGVRTELAGVVDLEALEQERYDEVLESVDARLSTAQYSLISMLVAGIYFGLLVGTWLVSISSWIHITRWVVPVLLVTIYAVYSSYHTIREIRELSEARSLLRTLAAPSSDATTSTSTSPPT